MADATSVWAESALKRIFPTTPPRSSRAAPTIRALRGERVSFQVAVRAGDRSLTARASPLVIGHDLEVTVRCIGYVPLRQFTTEVPATEIDSPGELPALVPDPILPTAEAHVPPGETRAFWVTVGVHEDARPGDHDVAVHIETGECRASVRVTVRVGHVALPQRVGFPVTHWLYPDAIAEWHRTAFLSEPFWRLLSRYLADYTAHGADTSFVPLLTPPVDGVKRPTQLLTVIQDSAGQYQFRWNHVLRWIAECRDAGITTFEWPHLFTQWGARHPVAVYTQNGESEETLWALDAPAASGSYRQFLELFLPEFERFLRAEDLADRSWFHLSDEPALTDLESYSMARSTIREIAPWMRILDAVSHPSFVLEGLTDVPIALLPEVAAFQRRGIRPWAYFCCQPRGRYLNRFLDTPLTKIRMSGWLLHAMGVAGFLHWGYNYWYLRGTRTLADPFQVNDGGAWPEWAAGDPFVVYPSTDGPVPSVRWEVFAESLQDLAILRAIEPSKATRLLMGIHDFAEFPHSTRWLRSARAGLLNAIESA